MPTRRKRSRILQVGITGGIGSGKSVVCRFLASLGIPYYDADSRAKALYYEVPALKQAVSQAFGQDIYTEEGKLNTGLLAQRALSTPEGTAQLNALVHPHVFADYRQWLARHEDAPYIIKEAALLFESGSYRDLDLTILVQAPLETRIRRVQARDPHRTLAQIEAIIERQWPEDRKVAMAQYLLANGDEDLLSPRLLELHQLLLERANQMSPTLTHPQLAHTVLMVRPVDFAFNEETALDNEFQQRLQLEAADVNRKALEEFDAAVQRLRKHGITVLVLDAASGANKTPDAVFPNNWISTRADGEVLIYPMATANRRAETQRLPEVLNLFQDGRLKVEKVTDLVQEYGSDGYADNYLEGTGSLVFDHVGRIVYASISQRTHPELVQHYAQLMGYQAITFDTASLNGKPYYHTNVVMSVGDDFAVLCADAIPEAAQRQAVMRALGQNRELICITREQAEKKFCANLLQVANREGQRFIILSSSAFNGFTPTEISRLELYGRLIPLDINTIEAVGGGSARCMIAEVFLPSA